MQIEGRQAFQNTKEPFATWPVARRRLRSRQVFPETAPSFSLSRSDTVFTMGSCFARNIEEELARIGCKVPTREFSVPQSERGGPRQNHLLTLFTPPTFSREIRWAESIYQRDGKVAEADCADYAFELAPDQIIDLGLSGTIPVSYRRFVERRRELYDLYSAAFTAQCFVMTPGLVEAWFDKKTGKYINPTPMRKGVPLDIDRFCLDILDYETCLAELLAVIDIIRKYNPRISALITVSPVPLYLTFSGEDILVANTYSKSVLRAACECVVKSRERVDYFPSYEAVTLSTRSVWEKDRRHVDAAFVKKIVDDLAAKYFSGTEYRVKTSDKYRLSLTERIRNIFGFNEPKTRP